MNEKIVEMVLTKYLSNDSSSNNSSDLTSSLIGEYVIVRTRNEGLNCGYLERADETGCVITDARRIHRPISKDKNLSWYEGISVSGLDITEGRISNPVGKKVIIEDYSLISTSEIAKNSLINAETNKTDL